MSAGAYYPSDQPGNFPMDNPTVELIHYHIEFVRDRVHEDLWNKIKMYMLQQHEIHSKPHSPKPWNQDQDIIVLLNGLIWHLWTCYTITNTPVTNTLPDEVYQVLDQTIADGTEDWVYWADGEDPTPYLNQGIELEVIQYTDKLVAMIDELYRTCYHPQLWMAFQRSIGDGLSVEWIDIFRPGSPEVILIVPHFSIKPSTRI